MSKVTTPYIAFNRLRNDVHRLIGLEYIPPELREQTRMLMPIFDMLENKFTAAFYAHTSAPAKITDKQHAKLAEARDRAIRNAQIAMHKKQPVSDNPFVAGSELYEVWRKAWHFYTDGAPGGNLGFIAYVPPEND